MLAWACDIPHRAVVYLHHRFRMDMEWDEAKANFDARELLINCQNRVINEAEARLRERA